jgi:hypothetical protein
MSHSDLNEQLTMIRLIVFEVCETLIFVAFVLALAIFSLIHIYQFGRHLL